MKSYKFRILLLSAFVFANVFGKDRTHVIHTNPRGDKHAHYSIVAPEGQAELIWSDEFNGVSLDLYHPDTNRTGRWRAFDFWMDPKVAGYVDFISDRSFNINPISPSVAEYNPISVSDGTLKIKGQRALLSERPDLRTIVNNLSIAQGKQPDQVMWLGSWISACNKQNGADAFTYGYVESRIKFANSSGQAASFWLYSSQEGNNPAKRASEIDIVELMGLPKVWYTNIHMGGEGSDKSLNHTHNLPFSDDFHVYALDWQPTYLRVYYDNILQYEVTGNDAAWFNAPMRVIFSYAFDSGWFTGERLTNANSPSPQYMEVDYVRLYNRKPFSTGINLIDNTNQHSLYPNPFNKAFKLSLSPYIGINNASLIIYDMLGKKVKIIALTKYDTTVDRGGLQKGIYFYTIVNNNENIGNGKLILQ